MAGYDPYALDVETHPFIFCRTGKFEASQPWTDVYGYMHKMYEVLLDTAMAQYEYKEQAVYPDLRKGFRSVPKHQTTSKNFTMTCMETYGFVTTPGAVTASQKAALHIVETNGIPAVFAKPSHLSRTTGRTAPGCDEAPLSSLYGRAVRYST